MHWLQIHDFPHQTKRHFLQPRAHYQASLILGISGVVPEFPEINFEIVPKIRKSVACAGQFAFDLIHFNACEKLMWLAYCDTV